MKKQNNRRTLLVAAALLAAIVLVVVSAVASVFAYRQLTDGDGLRASIDLDSLQFNEDSHEGQGQGGEGQGVVILRVEPGSPAEEAGLSSGTVILSVNGQAVNSPQELRDVIRHYEVGDTITLTIQDGEETRDVAATLADSGPYLGVNVGSSGRFFHQGDEPFGEMPHGFVVPGPHSRRGPEGMTPFEFPFDEFGLEPFGDHDQFFDLIGKSALVMTVVEDGPAAGAGLQAGDAIVEANGQAIENSQQLIDLIAELSPGDDLSLEAQRGSDSVSFDVILGNHPDEQDRAYLGVFLAPGRFHRDMEFFQDRQNS